MTLYDDTVLNISRGDFYRAAVGTAKPSDLSAIPVAWTNLGHTSLDNIFSVSSEGGDITTLGTLQAKTLRQSTSNRTESFNFNLAQYDAESLKLYFGSNSVVDGTGKWLDVPVTPTPTKCAFLVVFQDGTQRFAFWAQNTEIKRGDDFSLSDTSSLGTLPLVCTPLSYNGSTSNYSVTPLTHVVTP